MKHKKVKTEAMNFLLIWKIFFLYDSFTLPNHIRNTDVKKYEGSFIELLSDKEFFFHRKKKMLQKEMALFLCIAYSSYSYVFYHIEILYH